MASRLMRRSGIAVGMIAEFLEWKPKTIIQAGVGLNCQETDVFGEEWPDCQFVGFEPNPILYKKLKGTYPGELHPVALGSFRGKSTLFFRTRHKDGGSIVSLKDVKGEKTETAIVSICRLDDMILTEDSNPYMLLPSLLWLDCEGSELNVLQGGMNTLRFVDVVNVEMTNIPPGDGWCKPSDVHDLLIENDFKLQYVHTFRSHSGQYDAIYVKPKLFRSEYCSFPCKCGR